MKTFAMHILFQNILTIVYQDQINYSIKRAHLFSLYSAGLFTFVVSSDIINIINCTCYVFANIPKLVFKETFKWSSTIKERKYWMCSALTTTGWHHKYLHAHSLLPTQSAQRSFTARDLQIQTRPTVIYLLRKPLF